MKAESVYSKRYGWVPPQQLKQQGVQGFRLDGTFLLEQFRGGSLFKRTEVSNLIVNTGLAGVAGLVIATGQTAAFKHIALGSNSTAVAATDTTLNTELTSGGAARALATLSRVTTTITNDTAQLVHTFTFSSTLEIREAGVFDLITAGVMLSRATFSAHSVSPSDTLAVTYKAIATAV